MRVTIKGTTPSTIAFNTLGIVVRGDSGKSDLYPESVARHIEIVNEDQLTEINSLVNANLISITVEDEGVPNKTAVDANRIVKTDNENTDDESSEDEPDQAKASRRGRPKGSKDSTPRVRKSKKDIENTCEGDSSVTVMTPGGAVKGEMRRQCAGEINDSERTAASIEALKKLEEEEELEKNLEDVPIDESKLALEEQMGLPAVISTGDDGATAVEMKNSVVPEADVIKNRGVEFVDKKDKVTTKSDAFIVEAGDEVGDDDDDGDDLDFLEF